MGDLTKKVFFDFNKPVPLQKSECAPDFKLYVFHHVILHPYTLAFPTTQFNTYSVYVIQQILLSLSTVFDRIGDYDNHRYTQDY